MKKTILVVGLILLVLVLAGCTSPASPANNNNNTGGTNQPSGLTASDLNDLGNGTDQIDRGLQDLNPTP